MVSAAFAEASAADVFRAVLVGGGLGRGLGRGLGSCGGVRGGWNGRNDAGQLDFVDFGEVGSDVGIALVGDQVLAGGFAIAGVDFVDHVHAFDDGAKGCETHSIEARIIAKVDEELSGAGVGAGSGEDQGGTLIALHDWIVLDLGVVPDLVDGRVGAEPELDNESRHYAKEGGVGEVAIADEVIKAVGAEGRPVAMDFDDEVARRGSEPGLEDRGGLGMERCGVEQGRPGSCWRSVSGSFGSGGLSGSDEGDYTKAVKE